MADMRRSTALAEKAGREVYIETLNRFFDAIDTLDRPRLAAAIAAEAQKQGRGPEILVQVNTGEEPQKAGILPEAADAFIAHCRDELKLPVAGLMCIPPADVEPAPFQPRPSSLELQIRRAGEKAPRSFRWQMP